METLLLAVIARLENALQALEAQLRATLAEKDALTAELEARKKHAKKKEAPAA